MIVFAGASILCLTNSRFTALAPETGASELFMKRIDKNLMDIFSHVAVSNGVSCREAI